MEIRIKNLDEMKDFASQLVKVMDIGDVFGLVGDLGAGKTSLVSFILESLGYNGTVSSPTFSFANVYYSDPVINHLDLYRLETEEEIETFEYEEYFYPENSITFIEWPYKAGTYLPRQIMYIDIKVDSQDRLVTLDKKIIERIDKK